MNYSRAPIVEAVIDLGFSSAYTPRELERIRDAFKKKYPTIAERIDVDLRIEAGGAPQPNLSVGGYQMNSADGTDVVLAQRSAFTTSRLTPYVSWEHLAEQAKSNFELLVQTVGRPKVNRIAARFINRLDIPNRFFNQGSIHDFISIAPVLAPDLAGPMEDFSVAATFNERETNAIVRLNCASQSPALLAHKSFVIDIDVLYMGTLPLKHEDMWDLISRLRTAKNNVFESSIKDAARELIK